MTASDPDRAFTALANSLRRRLLLDLLRRDPRTDVSIPGDVAIDESAAKAVHLELYHVHLPHLEEGGYVTVDRAAHTVSRGPNFDEIRPLLELLDRHRDELPDGWI